MFHYVDNTRDLKYEKINANTQEVIHGGVTSCLIVNIFLHNILKPGLILKFVCGCCFSFLFQFQFCQGVLLLTIFLDQ